MIELQHDMWNLIHDKTMGYPEHGGSGFEMVRT